MYINNAMLFMYINNTVYLQINLSHQQIQNVAVACHKPAHVAFPSYWIQDDSLCIVPVCGSVDKVLMTFMSRLKSVQCLINLNTHIQISCATKYIMNSLRNVWRLHSNSQVHTDQDLNTAGNLRDQLLIYVCPASSRYTLTIV